MRVAAALAPWVVTVAVLAQGLGEMQGVPGQAERQRAYVSYVAEPTIVAAGKRSVVEVPLRVAEGYHVNSHTPKTELLIPTTLTLEPKAYAAARDSGGEVTAAVGDVEYPKGTSYSFAANPGEVLDVYTGAVTLRVPVTVKAGSYELRGSLRYQACDRAACYPPKTLAVTVPFTAR